MNAKVKKCFKVASAICAFALVSCTNQLEDIDVVETKNVESIAETFVDNLFSDFSFGAKRRSDNQEYPSFLYDLDITDDYGNKVSFADLSESEKKEMADFWAEDYKSELIGKLSDDGELLDYVSAQNKAVKKAEKIYAKTLICQKMISINLFLKNL